MRNITCLFIALLHTWVLKTFLCLVEVQWPTPVTGGDQRDILPPPPHLPLLPDAGGGLVSWGLPAAFFLSHAVPWLGGRQCYGSPSRWESRRHQWAARRKCWTSSPWLFEQSCNLYMWKFRCAQCTFMNPNVRTLYDFEVNNYMKSNLKLSSPSPRIAATTWSAPSSNFSGHCKQVEAHLEQHLRVNVLLRGRRIRTSLTGIWCIGTCQR